MYRRLNRIVVLSLLLGSGAAHAAAPAFARIFGDHAVLQRDRPLTIWGSADPAERITVSLADRSASVRADSHGRWRATLPAMAAGGPYRLAASSAGGTTTLGDIKIGDVYLCGGQSNMEFPARLSTNAWNGLAGSANDDLRFVNIVHDSAPAPLDDLGHPAPWQVVSPDTVGEASAVCYYMARSLQKTAKVPIGFIHSSWGGTTIQSWISAASLAGIRGYAEGTRTVTLLASDPARARAQEERRQEAWWDSHDPSAAAQRAWIAPGFDDSGWSSVTAPGLWKDAGPADLAGFQGVTWLRTTVTLTEAQARSANKLQLGPIDTFDSAWVNGVWVGSNTIPWVERNYDVPAGVFHAGVNTIVLRIFGGSQGGGLTGLSQQRRIATAGGETIAVSAPWRYRTGMRAAGLKVPALPWAVPTSLTTLNNAMIAPLRGYGFKLAAWYQGESNASEAGEYRALLPLMMADWRQGFGQPDLPFLVTQLTAYGPVATSPGRSDWAELRQAQADAVAADRHATLIVTIDVGDRYDVHPTQKTVVGERLARAARALVYGEAITTSGPVATAVTKAGSDLVVAYRNTNGGLKTYSAAVAIGFEACAGDACSYVPGVVRGDTVVLAGANQPGITGVRYAWADAPYVNLFSANDLPAAPFELGVGAN